jgi:hypothetical protein
MNTSPTGALFRKRSCSQNRLPAVAVGNPALFLQACSGDQGSAGFAGPRGPPGSGATIDVANAETITAIITSVTVPAASQPVVLFGLADELERPLSGLTASQIRFVVLRLAPGQNGHMHGLSQ